jgi:hypothetical protein
MQREQQLQLDYAAAKNAYQLAIDTYQSNKDNLALAERIERKNNIKFKEGISSSFELDKPRHSSMLPKQNTLIACIK